MLDRPGIQGWVSGEMGMAPSVRGDRGGLRHPPQSWRSAACPFPAFTRADVVLSLMCAFLGTFILIELFKGVFLLATALVSPGDSSYNNYGFMLCLCQTQTIHQLQLACLDVFSGDLDFDGLFSPEISLIE